MSKSECGRAIVGAVQATLRCIHLYIIAAGGIPDRSLGHLRNFTTGFPRRTREARRRKGEGFLGGGGPFVWMENGKDEQGKADWLVGKGP
jgi:hypothetical protein